MSRPYRLPKGIRALYATHKLPLITVRKVEHLNAVGIHLSRPQDWELQRALEDALNDSFPAVYVHDDVSWDLRLERQRAIRARRDTIKLAVWNEWTLRTDPRGELRLVGVAS